MKTATLLIPVLLALASSALADLKLELPKTNLVLQPGALPLLQRESVALPAELETIQKVVPLLNGRKPDQALQQIKLSNPDFIEQLEAGDPKGTASARVIGGNTLYPPPAPNAVSAAMLYLIGNIYMNLQNYPTAELAFRRTLDVMPDYSRARESYGLLLLKMERYREAVAQLSRAAQLGLTTPQLYGALGYLNSKMNNHFGALSSYQTAMMLEPEEQQWQQGLLFSLASTKQTGAGLALVDQLLNTYPNDPGLWVFRSSMQLDAGNKQQGLNSLEAAIRLGEDSQANLQVCASLHMEIGSVERAVTLLKAGMSKGLDFSFLDQSLTWLVAREQWASLQKLLDEVGKTPGLSDVQQSRVLLHRGSFSVHNNDNAQAKNSLQQSITLDPANADALLALGQLFHREKNYGQAELLLQRASASRNVKENALLELAQIAIDQHNYARALQILRDTYANNPLRTDLGRNISTLENLVQLEGKN